ncbi:RraA family protein [Sphingomonas sp. AOB5]|uniref:RraA family protein n=1 Tax=Sphingomonas sp. AOB5 TaxID=3034017 RepID=UPI0023F74D85|nr:RraA family protein [Sphingomonas sp. AOB5]MDF7776299.1 RraA family protein [Sphingomonas sp. AOB5]
MGMHVLRVAAMAASLWLAQGLATPAQAQIQASREEILFYTQQWTGERFPDGRPKVSDAILARLLALNTEQVWEILRQEGYANQFEGGFQMVHADRPFVGRALTVQYLPSRPDMAGAIGAQAKKEGRVGNPNSWPIDMLQVGDVYVADGNGKVIDGTLMGDNLGNTIYARSRTGVVFDGGARDIEGLAAITGFNAYVRGFDPSFIKDLQMARINAPVRIGRATVLPGDLVLARREGVIFVPAVIAEKVVLRAEYVALRDAFSHDMLRQGRFSAGAIDQRWTPEINAAFLKWVDEHPEAMKMSRADLTRVMREIEIDH